MNKVYVVTYLDNASKLHYAHPFTTYPDAERYANKNINHVCIILPISKDKYERLKTEILSNADKVESTVIN